MATANDKVWPPTGANLCRTGREPDFDGISCYRRPGRGTPTRDEDCMCSRAYDKWFDKFKHRYNYGYLRR